MAAPIKKLREKTVTHLIGGQIIGKPGRRLNHKPSRAHESWSVAVLCNCYFAHVVPGILLHQLLPLTLCNVFTGKGQPSDYSSAPRVRCAWGLLVKPPPHRPMVGDGPCTRSARVTGRGGNGRGRLWRKGVSAGGNFQPCPRAVATPRAAISRPCKWSFTCRQKSRWSARHLGHESFWKSAVNVCQKAATQIKL